LERKSVDREFKNLREGVKMLASMANVAGKDIDLNMAKE